MKANPASSPIASIIGKTTVHVDPLVPATGPAYFVSHGNAKFPDVVFVLQGEEPRSTRETFISKHGITTSTFKASLTPRFSTLN